MTKKEQSILRQAHQIASRERAKEQAKKTAENRKLIGTCYCYRNSYGGNDDSQRWWLYCKITGVDATGGLRALKFETDHRDGIRIDPEYFLMSVVDGYEKINPSEFDAALDRLKETVQSLA